jgi:hypothetical protein
VRSNSKLQSKALPHANLGVSTDAGVMPHNKKAKLAADKAKGNDVLLALDAASHSDSADVSMSNFEWCLRIHATSL